ncbi:hypothetical protein ACO1O0_003017 [Amphichorda felina]
MPESETSSSAPSTAVATPGAFGENKGIRFHITTGGKSWACTLQDRSAYERMKSTRTSSTDSVDSSASSTTEKSA